MMIGLLDRLVSDVYSVEKYMSFWNVGAEKKLQDLQNRKYLRLNN